MNTGKSRLVQRALVGGAVLSLVVCAAIAARVLVLGSARAGWFYGYEQAFTVSTLAVSLLVSAAAASAMLWLPSPRSGRHEWCVLGLSLLLSLASHAALRPLAPYSLASIVTSDGANSFYGFAQQQRWSDVLAHFGRLSRAAPLHAQGNMPGKVTLVYALQFFAGSPSALAVILVCVSASGGVLMYIFARDLFGDRRTALFAAILYSWHPARIFFLPLMNTVTPVAVLATACLLVRWLRTGRAREAIALGIGLYVLVFFEPLPLVMGLLFAALAVRSVAAGEITATRIAVHSVIVLAAFIATSEAVYAASGFELLGALSQVTAYARAFNASAGRAYQFWVLENPVEFLFGVGVCQSALFAVAAYGERLTSPIAALCAGLAAVLLAVDLIGINRGEVLRLWIFLGCFFQIPAAYACATMRGPRAIATVVACTVLQVSIATRMIGFVVP